MDLTLMDNKNGTDEYGNDGFIVQSVTKEKREAGIKGPIIGNWKHVGQRPTSQNGAAPPKPIAAMDDSLDESDDVPF